MRRSVSMWFIVGIVVTCLAGDATAQRPPEGQLIIAFTSSITSAFLDPSEPELTSLIFLYIGLSAWTLGWPSCSKPMTVIGVRHPRLNRLSSRVSPIPPRVWRC
jgi:glucose uptake protein GlcU